MVDFIHNKCGLTDHIDNLNNKMDFDSVDFGEIVKEIKKTSFRSGLHFSIREIDKYLLPMDWNSVS